MAKSQPRRRRATGGVIQILKPATTGSGCVGNVRVKGSGMTSGTICSEGTAGLNGSGQSPNSVAGKVMPPGTAYAHNPNTEGGTTAGVVNGRNWCIKRGVATGMDIPNAQCGPASAPVTNQLVIWVGYPDGSYESQELDFDGICASDTDCGGSTDCPSDAIVVAKTQGKASALETAPVQWAVTVTGFLGGAGAVFNGNWLLTLRQTGDLYCVWDNGGDAATSPRIELCYDRPLPTVLQLVLQHRSCAYCYTKPAAEWNWLKANVLQAVSPNGISMPEALQVVPA
jgi:hypothetical protein